MRDCRISLIYEGTNGIQALDLVGRKLAANGGRAVMTSPAHQTGSDRIKEAADIVDPERRHDIIVNVQGDLPFLQPAEFEFDTRKALHDQHLDLKELREHIAERTNSEIPPL